MPNIIFLYIFLLVFHMRHYIFTLLSDVCLYFSFIPSITSILTYTYNSFFFPGSPRIFTFNLKKSPQFIIPSLSSTSFFYHCYYYSYSTNPPIITLYISSLPQSPSSSSHKSIFAKLLKHIISFHLVHPCSIFFPISPPVSPSLLVLSLSTPRALT